MYKFFVLGVVLSLQLSDVVGLSFMNDPEFIRSLHAAEGSDTNQDYAYDYFEPREQNFVPPGMPEFTIVTTEAVPEDKSEYQPEEKKEDEPEDKPQVQSADNPEVQSGDKPEVQADNIPKDLENKLDNIVQQLGNLIKVTAKNRPTESSGSTTNMVKELSSEYLVTKGMGAHKLHLRKLSWNQARKVCIDEGGQLADIRSDSEEKILLRMLSEEDVEFAWVGYHDIFEEGDWVSVLGEPLGKSGWDRWWKKRLPNPDNVGGEEDCACLMRDGGGMNDNNCSKELPFICKITAL